MKKHIQLLYIKIALLILLISSLFSCIKTKNYDKHLKGDWISQVYIDSFNRTQLMFTFEDSLCSLLSPFSNLMNYELKNDKIKIIPDKNTWKSLNEKDRFQLKVQFSTDSTMFLKAIDSLTKQNLQFWDKEIDTIKLFKVRTKNQLNFEKIGFYSSVCFGRCPQMYLEIDNNRNLCFYGVEYTSKKGGFRAKISIKEYQTIVRKIQQIKLDALKKSYYAEWTDDQECGVIIQTKSGKYQCSAYGFDKEPIELRLLFHKLMNIYKNVDLVKDEKIEEKFTLIEMMKRKTLPLLQPK